ncbi:MAG TPA: DUF2726 domain-containing protein [Rhizomicrobium sp.]|nr:DUF2726 domain-containing protein [Rhizomicrobium sp.]
MTAFETESLAGLCALLALVLLIAAFRTKSSSAKGSQYRTWGASPSRGRSQNDYGLAVPPVASSHSSTGIPDLSDVGVQLNAIMKAAFSKRRVMNRSEYEVFKIVESEVVSAKKGHRAFAQTSLGQVLESPSSDAFRSVNAKRVDILVVDRGGWPVFAVEYQGRGHYQGTAAARDAIKKEALRRAGVAYLEVTPNDSEDRLRLRIREYLGVKSPEPPKPGGRSSVHSSTLVPQLH